MDLKINLNTNSPQEKGISSKILFWWCFRLFHKGHKHGITIEDLWRPPKKDRSEYLGDRLEKAWLKEVQAAEASNTQPLLGKAIIKCFWFEYMLYGIGVGVLFIAVWPMVPYTLALFVGYFSGEKTSHDYLYAHVNNLIMNLCIIGIPLLINHLELLQGAVGMRVRVACCSLMYRKVLKLNHRGIKKTDAGQVINIMSNDVNRFDLASLYLHYIWVMPILIVYVSYLVWQCIGWATLAGLVVILLQTLLMQSYLSVLQTDLRRKIAKRTDERIKVMNELVNGVQVIRMYAWENYFEKIVDKLRKLEIRFITKTSMIKGFSTAIMIFTERLVLFAAVVSFTVGGGLIRSGIAFSLVQNYNLLQRACSILFPWALTYFGESKISVKRIEEFLLLDEGNKKASNEKHLLPNPKDANQGVQIAALDLKAAHALWDSSSTVPSLCNVSLSINPGEFIGIIGPVGSGKSSLLQVILGELELSNGELSLGNAKISYACQEPWLFAGTIRQNILFGLPYNQTLYDKVIQACALIHDLELLPNGDSTVVGDRGVTLSGGQKARVSLARACYRKADIYLLDDPLSAVDTHVGKHLVSECVNGLLRHSTRVLVTHQLHHLKTADKVVILRNGEIEAQGTYKKISNTEFMKETFERNDCIDNRYKKSKTNIKKEYKSKSSMLDMDTRPERDENGEPQETDEFIKKGRVTNDVYKKYFFSSGKSMLTWTVITIVIAQIITSSSDLWFTHWINSIETRLKQNNANNLDSNFNITSVVTKNLNGSKSSVSPLITNNQESTVHLYFIYIWSATLLGCILFTTGRSFLFMAICMRSSVKLHKKMFSNILTATMRFFTVNPSGRILNRFSKDMGVVDEILPKMFLESIQIALVTCGIIAVVTIMNPYMVLAAIFCGVFMYLWSMVYVSTAQSVKRLEGVTRSPVFSHVAATMAGLTTVRACDAQTMLLAQFDEKQDVHTSAWYLTLATNTSFAIWLSFIAALFVLIVTYAFLLLDDGSTKSGNVGLAVSQALVLINMLQYGIKQITQVVSQMTSVERVLEYTNLPQEVSPKTLPPKNWPEQGRIVIKDLYLRYDEGLEPVLRNLNIVIEGGWKVGIVGRTGAGKTSLVSAIFRLAQVDGQILIDDVNTGTINLKGLRSRISIIPQEPVLFSASLRYNLDPFDLYSDEQIWKALEQVGLKDNIKALSLTVESGGLNFSAGERQLLCLARAALASNRLLILDEATANVDPKTDELIHKSIRENFSDCTVLTVAHRLHTIADADRIIVMEEGQIIEFDHPQELLQNEDSHFSKMVKELS
ncbi:ATP-binding cassette sub-family C member 4-like [Aricia agestis]|uniref:ATP-binding cassette sub-family C member 4-like n=1 Tax=Aricia agestis TaxID=91739 RepID=UPI001C20A194|nr:ATP-binding cassette sub-family C member 4-like [Aricia agestis]